MVEGLGPPISAEGVAAPAAAASPEPPSREVTEMTAEISSEMTSQMSAEMTSPSREDVLRLQTAMATVQQQCDVHEAAAASALAQLAAQRAAAETSGAALAELRLE